MKYFLIFLMLCLSQTVFAQHTITFTVVDSSDNEKLIGVNVFSAKLNMGSKTNQNGEAVFQNVPNGSYEFIFSYIGFKKQSLSLDIKSSLNISVHLIALHTDMHEIEITSTRNNARLENTPIKIEVLGAEEMKEENGIKPGNVASILGDISSIQLQQTNASSGNTNVRIQGLNGKYTQLMRDGFPQYDGFASGFGIMQIPPLDLKQIEIIKGSASTLFGGDAIGGLINFISKTPTNKPEKTFTINESSLLETNINSFFAAKKNNFGYTVFSGITFQPARDVNKDSMSDVPKTMAVNLHPRLFFYGKKKEQLAIGYNITYETRLGGEMQTVTKQANLFYEKNTSFRQALDAIYTKPFGNKNMITIKSSINNFNLNFNSNTHSFTGNQTNAFVEASIKYKYNTNDIIIGTNYKGNYFYTPTNSTATQLNTNFNTVGLFAQATNTYKNKLITQVGIRNDYHFVYGNFFLPSAAVIYKLNNNYYIRANAGMGYKVPNVLQQNNRAYESVSISNKADAEKSLGANIEFNFHKRIDELNITCNQSFFITNIYNPILDSTHQNAELHLYNASKPTLTKGSDTYIRASYKDFEIYLGYTYTLPRQLYTSPVTFLPTTPLHRFANTIIYEANEKWQIGFENSFTGKQYLANTTTTTKPYWFLAGMVKHNFEKVSIVLNCENILNVRQSKYEKIYVGTLANPTFKALWAPLEGRIINLSGVIKL